MNCQTLQHPRLSTNELLTDFYQLTMAYSYYKQGRHNLNAVFDAFFRKAPFKGKFAIFAGLYDVVTFIKNFKFRKDQIYFLRDNYPHWSEDFFEYLESLDGSNVKIYAIKEGSIVFPKAPVLQLEGPLGFLQLIETTVLNLLNFPTLVATNGRRMKLAAGPNKTLIEFGLRRAQGPDGAMMATQYSYLGGFDGTSNVAGGKDYGIPIYGTMAHAYICSFKSLDEVKVHTIDGKDLREMAVQIRKEMNYENTNEGELAAFIAYACDHFDKFLALVDTYDSMHSGIPNFIAVAIALIKLGKKPKGIRLDSGDLGQLSKDARKLINEQAAKFNIDLSYIEIFASNDLNEPTLLELKKKGHEITAFGIGTNLVTCQAQPALGMVYKLVEIEGVKTMKFSEDADKIMIPGRKRVYRLYIKRNGLPVADVIASPEEDLREGETISLRDVADRSVRLTVLPEKIQNLYELVWNGETTRGMLNLHEARDHCERQVEHFRQDVLDLIKPENYKVYVTQKVFETVEQLHEENAIWRELTV